MVNRQEKIKQAQILEKQINDLKKFCDVLKRYDTEPYWNRPLSFVKRNTSLSFLGIWQNNNSVEIEIPEFMHVEIAAKCIKWINELEKRADELVGS